MAVLWPFPVDWSDGYRVTLSFLTDIITSRTGKEQRQALRATPRRRVDFTSRPTRTAFAAFKALIAKSQDVEILMPDATRFTAISAGVASGASAVVLAALPYWAVPGRWLILSDGAQVEQTQILSVAGTTLTLSGPLAHAWAIGARLTAGMLGHLETDVSWSQPTSQVAEVRVSFNVTPGSEALLGSAAPATFNSRELFLLKPNWGNGMNVRAVRDVGRVDYEIGLIETFEERDFSTVIREATWLARSTADVEALQGFFERALGRRGEFYAPTWEADLTPAAALAAGGSTLLISGLDAYAAFADSTQHAAIAVVLKDGTVLRREVAAFAESGDDTLLSFASTWPADVALSEIQTVSWLMVCRFATDELVLDYVTDSIANVRMSHQTLEALTPES